MSELIEAMQPDLGFAYLIVSHMEARQESHLAEILAKRTLMSVKVAESQELEPNTVYVIPPDSVMTIEANHVVLRPRDASAAKNLPIDALLASLADRSSGTGIVVVLSGTGSDGSEGIKKVKESGGIVFAQAPESATFEGMPKAAISTGCVDFALRPSSIAKEIGKIALHPYLIFPNEFYDQASTSEAVMGQIFELIAKVYHADFTQYKPNTIQRRLQRRMALINETDLQSYLGILYDNPVELAALYDDLLIRVTCFFREEAIYTALTQTVFSKLFEKRNHTEPLRIWVPACASGEEVYSFAICLLEYLGENSQDVTIQIFGTDLNEAAIETARNGLYPDSIAERVSPERLQRYFVREQKRYRISKQVRELCVFARQNVVLDPPFSRMDVISCCNFLIYLDAGLQKRVLRHFHYALKADGFLILGPAETADDDSHSFKRAEGNQRMLYQPSSPARGTLDLVLSRSPVDKQSSAIVDSQPAQFWDATQVQRKADGILLSRFSPASILVDDRLNIVQFRGQTSPYLEHSSGTASLNLHRVAQPSILMQLMPLLKEVHETGNTVFRDDLRIDSVHGQRNGSVEIIPLREPATKTAFCLILFDANVRPIKPEGRPEIPESQKDARIRQLEGELDGLRDYLQATNEAYEAALEESRSAQEELQSANEEFLSGNEELVISREELQATNEELTTSNEELLSRSRELQILNTELSRTRKEITFNANYAESIIDTVSNPLLVLDQALCIHRANHAFYDTFMTNPSATLNRRLFELGDGQWNIPALRVALEQILSLSTPVTAYRVKHDFPGIGIRTMLINGRKVPALDDRSARILIAFEDVTASDDRLVNLRSDDRRKDEFIAMLAHELRNPLAPIRNAVQLMKMKATDESLQRPLGVIDRQVDTLARLVSDLMDLSRITRGQLLLEKKNINLNSLLGRIIESITPYMDSRGHQLIATLPPSDINVLGDPTRLEQVFNNLLNNSGKYTDRGGVIRLNLEVEGANALVTVTDNGSGIARNILPHVFDLFVQSDNTRIRAEGGLGIGLTLVRQIVEAHAGRVDAASEGVGQGSEFTVRLPLTESVEPTLFPVITIESENRSFQPRRVLVVDDNVDAANTSSDMLRSWGHEVANAYDGFSALEIARTFLPNVCILDIGLPKMSGLELAEKLRAMLPGKIFLIALTGYGRPSDYRLSVDAGFDVHLVKPIEVGPLQVLLATLSPLKSPM